MVRGEWLENKIDWTEGGRVHNWKNHVPNNVRAIWASFTDAQKYALYGWASELAEQEEWE